MADKKKSAKGKAPDEKPVKKKRRRKSEDEESFPGVSVAAHPRAGASVRRVKGVGGIAGFGVAAALSLKAGVPTQLLGERAIGGGIAGYLIAWGAGVTVWRQLVLAEMRTASEIAQERHQALLEARRARQIGAQQGG